MVNHVFKNGRAKDAKFSAIEWISLEPKEPYAHWSLAKGAISARSACRSEEVMSDVVEFAPDCRSHWTPQRVEGPRRLPAGPEVVEYLWTPLNHALQCGRSDAANLYIVLRVDGDMYESTMDALVNLYAKLSAGEFAIIDDYHAVQSCKQAVEDFRKESRITTELAMIPGGGVFWKKEAA